MFSIRNRHTQGVNTAQDSIGNSEAHLTNEVMSAKRFRQHFTNGIEKRRFEFASNKYRKQLWFRVNLLGRNAGEIVFRHTIVTYAKLVLFSSAIPRLQPLPLIVTFCPYNCSFVRVIRTFCCCFMAALLCSADPDPDPLTRPRSFTECGNILLVNLNVSVRWCVCVCLCAWRLLLDIMAAI